MAASGIPAGHIAEMQYESSLAEKDPQTSSGKYRKLKAPSKELTLVAKKKQIFELEKSFPRVLAIAGLAIIVIMAGVALLATAPISLTVSVIVVGAGFIAIGIKNLWDAHKGLKKLNTDGHVALLETELKSGEQTSPDIFKEALKDYNKLKVAERDPGGKRLRLIMKDAKTLVSHGLDSGMSIYDIRTLLKHADPATAKTPGLNPRHDAFTGFNPDNIANQTKRLNYVSSLRGLKRKKSRMTDSDSMKYVKAQLVVNPECKIKDIVNILNTTTLAPKEIYRTLASFVNEDTSLISKENLKVIGKFIGTKNLSQACLDNELNPQETKKVTQLLSTN